MEVALRFRSAINLKEGFYQGGVSISEVSLSMLSLLYRQPALATSEK